MCPAERTPSANAEIELGVPGWQGLLPGPRPLRAGLASGPLAGIRVAVKDLFDVAGTVTGAGNPTWARQQSVATDDAPAVAQLALAGAELVAKAATDEFAYSLDGVNAHFGTPANSRAPGHLPGGSSSGPAAAVAAGLADLGLGTDTAGSIRVPASYCGLFGYRPTHGVISVERVVALAPSFDTVGLLSRSLELLQRAATVLGSTRPGTAPGAIRFVIPAVVDEVLDPEIADRFHSVLRVIGAEFDLDRWSPPAGMAAADLRAAYLALSRREAWAAHGRWVERHWDALGADVGTRFEAASLVSASSPEWIEAGRVRTLLRTSLPSVVGADSVLLMPAAANPPLPLTASAQDRVTSRAANIGLCATAGLCGAPAVVIPVPDAKHLPYGLCVVALPGYDSVAFEAAAGLTRLMSETS